MNYKNFEKSVELVTLYEAEGVKTIYLALELLGLDKDENLIDRLVDIASKYWDALDDDGDGTKESRSYEDDIRDILYCMSPEDFKKIRKENKLTQEQCAQFLGCTKSSVEKMEYGTTPIQRHHVDYMLMLQKYGIDWREKVL